MQKLPRLLLLWLVSEACQTSMSVQVVLKWLRLPLTSKQPAVIYHMTSWWVVPWIQLLYVICGGENGTTGCHLSVFRVNVAFAHHFVATCLPPTFPPYRSASGIVHASKNYLKCWAIQLTIHPIVGLQRDYNSYRIVANFIQASDFLAELQYFK